MTLIWVDAEREMPKVFTCYPITTYHSTTVANTNAIISICCKLDEDIYILLDYDAGKCATDGGDYIQILNFLEFKSHEDTSWKDYIKNKVTFHLHTADPVGRENMRRIIQKNSWREI